MASVTVARKAMLVCSETKTTLDFEASIAATRLHLRRPTRILLAIAGVAWVSMAFLIFAQLSEAIPVTRVGAVLLPGLGACAGSLTGCALELLFHRPRALAKELLGASKKSLEVRALLGEDGVELSWSSGKRLFLPWSQISTWKMDDRSLVIYTGKYAFEVLPVAELGSLEKEALQAHLPDRARGSLSIGQGTISKVVP